MAQTALSNRQRRIIRKAGRPRAFGILREPNGRASRAKVEPPNVWLAPEIVKRMNTHPIDALETRGAITADMRRTAFRWLSDRALSGLPFTSPPASDLLAVKASADRKELESAKRRYHELHALLTKRCGAYGCGLFYELTIEGRMPEIAAQYFARLDMKPMRDPTEGQRRTWEHLRLAFEEAMKYYQFHERR